MNQRRGANAAGRRVRAEAFARQRAGAHSWIWDGEAQGGVAVGSGVYYVRLTAAGRVFNQRIALLR